MPPRRAPPPAANTRQAQATWRSPVPADHNRHLPREDAELFTKVLGMYENKQFKDGLEGVQSILDKHPNHGESLVMKGIFLCSLDRKPEGYDCVRRGTKNDPGSHIVWHVYALVLRADKNFEEALKCYKKAVEIEKDSLNLLSDMAPLAVHLRKYDDHAEIRLQMLKTQPRVRRNWVNLAVAQFLARQYRAATVTLAYYEDMLRDVPDGDVEMGEVLLFHAQVLEEAGEYERCLDFLGDKSAQIVDRTAYTVQRARLLLKLGRTESALWAWETVLGENPESTEYIKATVQAKGGDCDATDSETRLATSSILSALATAHPRSLSIKRLQLSVLPASSPEFRTRAASYILNALSKGVPSAFADVKALYKGAEGKDKARVVGEVVEEFKKGLEDKGAVVTDETSDDDALESPSTYLWTLYFLASHHSQLGDHSAALSTLSLALSHTPSLPELHSLRARILKRAGDAKGAAQAMEDARLLDGQDRFLNSKAAKYAVRNGEFERAEKTIGLFTRKDAPSPLEDMVEMQCLWFLQEEGDSYAAQQDWGRALRRYHQILDIFQDIEEDQYDFHSYCVRKYTLKAYIELLRFEDRVRDHPRFVAAAKGAVAIYCRMHDDPSAFGAAPAPVTNGDKTLEVEEVKQEHGDEGAEEPGLSRKEKKKAKGKAKKADTKDDKKKDEETKAVAESLYKDTDPLGVEHLKNAQKDPLELAMRFVSRLEIVRPTDEETLRLKAEVMLRRGKPLEALRALQTAQQLYPSSPAFLPLVVRLSQSSASNSAVSTVLSSGIESLLGGAQPSAFVDAQLQTRGEGSAAWLVAAAEAKLALGDRESAEALFLQVVQSSQVSPSLELLVRAHGLLADSPAAQGSFRQGAAQLVPLARAFKTADELQALDAKAEMDDAEARVTEEA